MNWHWYEWVAVGYGAITVLATVWVVVMYVLKNAKKEKKSGKGKARKKRQG
jgi:uncharacterized membrane protein YukC